MKASLNPIADQEGARSRAVDLVACALLMGVVLGVSLVFSWRTVGSGYIKNVVLAALVLSGIAVWLVHMMLAGRVEFSSSWPISPVESSTPRLRPEGSLQAERQDINNGPS